MVRSRESSGFFKARLNSLKTKANCAFTELEQTDKALAILRDQFAFLKKAHSEQNRKLSRANAALRRRMGICARVSQKAIKRALLQSLKGPDGAIKEEIRDAIRDLASLGIPETKVCEVINIVTRTFGLDIHGSFSATSVRRIITEGLIASEMQICDEVSNAKGILAS